MTFVAAAVMAAGVWDGLLNLLGYLLAFFYGVIPSYGIAIILLTIVVRLVLFPVTAKQAKSMLAMQRVAPEIKRLQAQYKNDRQKLNEEMMKFYKENKINPAAGCLPLLLQMPIFIALFGVLRNAYKHVPIDSKLYKAFCGAHETVASCKKAGPRGLHFLGMDLSKAAQDHHPSFTDALPYFILIALVIATGYFQQRQMQGRPGQAAANPQAQMMGYIFPIFFGLISLRLPAGVVVYFFVSNLWQMGQQTLVYKSLPATDGANGVITPPPPTTKQLTGDTPSDRGNSPPSSEGTRPADRGPGRTGGQQRPKRKKRRR
jgi:YidC/Oxa1 family membrane protein insertase